jgi:hypothetical protein
LFRNFEFIAIVLFLKNDQKSWKNAKSSGIITVDAEDREIFDTGGTVSLLTDIATGVQQVAEIDGF